MRRLLILLAANLLAAFMTAVVLAAALHAAPAAVILQPNCRLGYASGSDPARYPITDLARLDAGQFVGFNASAGLPQPAGAEGLQMVRMHQDKTCPQYTCPYVLPYTYTVWPSRDVIATIAQARPGSLWLLGNETDYPDVVWGHQDEMLPELYARAYHELRDVVRGADPTARIANSGVIQATPLRLQYLERMWNEYVRLYGTGMPVDVWNVHGFVLREKHFYPGCPDCWGADVPAGSNASYGMLYRVQDSISLTLFSNQIVAFRQWMASKGQRDKPLLVSEYSALPWDYYPPGQAVNYVLTGTFAFMRDTTDPAIGYPGDGNRLVQRWVYYSLDDSDQSTSIFENGVLSALGHEWTRYVNDPANGFNPRQPSLHLRSLSTDPAVLYAPEGGSVDATLYPQVDNSGNISTTQGFSVRLRDSQWPLGGISYFGALDGCGARAAGSGVTFYGMAAGWHTVTVSIDAPGAEPPGQVRLLVATQRALMPYVTWGTSAITP